MSASGLPSNGSAVPQGREILQGLEGLAVDGGWIIGRRLQKEEGQTGGHFSEGYECQHENGEVAFLKAIDLFEALEREDILQALNTLTDGVICEQELLTACRKMDRVVSVVAHGTIRQFSGARLTIPIPYIIFERADGNVRHVVRASERPTQEWILRTLHHVATGLMQLHRERISHQDLKLSNALQFKSKGVTKIADLGRSVRQGRAVWYDRLQWPGANSYAPPEVAYGLALTEFNVQRFASDMYLLGSFACALLTGSQFNPLLYSELPREFRPPMFGGTYGGTFENVSAHLVDAVDRALLVVAASIPDDAPYRPELLSFLRQWCAPDPRLRGHPATRAVNGSSGNSFDLERYVSALPNLAVKAAVFERRRKHAA